MIIKKNIIYLIFYFKFVKSFENLFDNEETYQRHNENSQFDYRKVSDGPCNIPIVTAPITQSEFLDKYAFSSPVIFKRTPEEVEKNRVFTQKRQLDRLIEEYGDKFVTVSIANAYSYKKYSMKFSSYLKQHVIPYSSDEDSALPKDKYGNETWYFFGENNHEWQSLLNLYARPKYNLPSHEHAYSFGIAARFTGVPFHFHGPGFAETIIGLSFFLIAFINILQIISDSNLHFLLKVEKDGFSMIQKVNPNTIQTNRRFIGLLKSISR